MAKQQTSTILDSAVLKDGILSLNGVAMQQIIDKCEGCDRVVTHETGGKYCASYAQPAAKWGRKACNFATHVRAEVDTTGKVKVNPLKASKRAARGR
jgi:hypothetical protein